MSKSLCVIEALESRQLLNAGQLDKSFGDAGKITFPADATIGGMVKLSDGRILVAGTENNSLFIDRFLPRGQLDPTYQPSSLAAVQKYGSGIVLAGADSADRPLLVSTVYNSGAVRIFRLTTRGALDKSFGVKGVVILPLSSISGISFLPDGQIVVRGSQPDVDVDPEFLITQQTVITVLHENGTIDTDFNHNGIALARVTEFSFDPDVDATNSSSVGADAAFQLPDKSIFYLQSVEDSGLVQDRSGDRDFDTSDIDGFAFKPDGSPDPSFKFDPKFILENYSGSWLQSDVIQLADGSIQFVRLVPDDSPNSTFNTFLDTMTPDGTISEKPMKTGVFGEHPFTLQESNGPILIASNDSTLARFDPANGTQSNITVDNTTAPIPTSAIQTDDGQILSLILSLFQVASSQSPSPSLYKLQESDSPTGTLQAQPLRISKSTSHRFQITWQDDKSVAWKTLGNGDIIVDSPDGSEHAARLLSVNKHHNSGIITATYAVAPPNGLWDSTANGAYAISVRANHVWDTEGNAAEGRVLGKFNIQIPPPATSPTTSIAKHLKKNAIRNDVLD